MNPLVSRVLENPLCKVEMASYFQQSWRGFELPQDMVDFYSVISEFRFDTEEYWFDFFKIEEFSSIDDRYFFHEKCNGEIISNHWCIFASQQGAFIAIDLDKKRFGRCHYVDFGMDYHVLALSFTEMINKVLDNNGTYPEWYNLDYKPIANICDF